MLIGVDKGKMGARSNGTVCGRCYQKFDKGDRITMAYIFDRAGRNPNNLMAEGAFLHEEFDLIHVDCNDPKLTKGKPK